MNGSLAEECPGTVRLGFSFLAACVVDVVVVGVERSLHTMTTTTDINGCRSYTNLRRKKERVRHRHIVCHVGRARGDTWVLSLVRSSGEQKDARML